MPKRKRRRRDMTAMDKDDTLRYRLNFHSRVEVRTIVQYTNIFVDSQMPLEHFVREMESLLTIRFQFASDSWGERYVPAKATSAAVCKKVIRLQLMKSLTCLG